MRLGARPASTPQAGWRVALRDANRQNAALAQVQLCNRALSGSGTKLHGCHITDVRGSHNAPHAATWASVPFEENHLCAARSDALSTAFMVMSRDEIETFCAENRGVAAAIMESENAAQIVSFGDFDVAENAASTRIALP